jgi:WD40 repeat protein/DNA-binding XRE family transcriptional regulator
MSASTPAISLNKFTTFGDLLKYLRRRAGLTQRELSNAVGYSDAQISRLEQNQRLPDPAIIEARFVPALFLEHEPQIVKRLMELAADVRREDAPALGLPPFKGLLYFDEADSDLFFGRETLTARLIERLATGIDAGERFLAVVGASGSGKSSVVRAGLIPALRWRSPSASWPIHVLTPTAQPLEALAASLTQEVESVTAAATLADDLARDPRSLQLFVKRGHASQVMLVVDQFEELFTLCRSHTEQIAFVNNLIAAAFEPDSPTIVVIALRADFYAHCADFADLRQALAQHQEYIGPMTPEELCQAIEEPARRGHWEYESGLIDLLLHDVGDEPGALPLLSHALLETWQRRRGRTLTLSGYLASGGVRGAIAETAESVFHDQLDRQQQLIARQIFLRLTELGEGTQDTRRRATLIELVPNPQLRLSVESVLKTLADARLITTSEGVAEVAHEALIREWPTLREWLADDREGLRLHRHLTEAAQEWERLDRDRDSLYRGARLAQAVEWANTHAGELNALERTFLEASQALAQQEEVEREAQRQRQLEAAQKLAESESRRAEEQARSARQLRRRARYLTGAFIVALVMALAAVFFGAQARQTTVTAQNDRRIATARELAAAALNNLSIDPERSILLALQAVTTTRAVDGTVLPEAEEALHRSIVASPIRMTLTGHGTRVLSADYRPDGKHLATIGDDGTTIVWDAATGEEVQRLPGTTKPSDFVSAQRIAYSPDGKLLAACDNGNVKVYDAATYKLLHTLIGHDVDMTAVSFSRDGTRLASADHAGTIFVWDGVTDESRLEFVGHADAVEDLTFSPDGKWLVTASDDATMKFWDAATGNLLRDFSDFTGEVTGVAFSPDGTRFAFVTADGLHVWQLDFKTVDGDTAIASREIFTIPEGGVVFSPDGTQLAGPSASGIGNAIKVWDASTGRELMTLNGHTGWVMGTAFSPDGKRLASTSLDGTVGIWSLTPGQETLTVAAPGAGYGTRVAYNPTGQEFATNGGDGTATIWSAETGKPRLTLRGHTLEVLNVAFNADGTRLATGSLDATAMVWDAATGQKLLTLAGHEFGVRDMAFSPDGKLIATGGFDGTARVWDTATGSLRYTITDHDGLVLGVAFSPDGTRLATSSSDTTAKIRDARTGEVLLALNGHSGALPDIAYSPDGTKLATGSGDGMTIIWDAVTGSPLFTLREHSSGIQSVSFNSNGTWLATGSEDNTAKVWDVATGKELLTLPGSGGGVKGVAFSPADDGAHLAVSSADGVVRVFLLQTDELLALAQSRVTRSLTTAECQKYLHVEECPAP